MEHAITPGLEEALDRMLGYPDKTPDGIKIPSVKRAVEPISSGLLLPLYNLPFGTTATIEIIALNPIEIKTLDLTGLGVGSKIKINEDGIYSNGNRITISDSIMKRITKEAGLRKVRYWAHQILIILFGLVVQLLFMCLEQAETIKI